MAIITPVYCTREDVQLALDVKTTYRDSALTDSAVMAAAGDTYGIMHRRFFPEDGVKYFDWPNYQYAYPWRIWLEQYDLVTATQVTTGGVTIPLGDIFFEPVNKEAGEPYTYMELDRSTNASFGVGPTPQRDVGITGTWGYCATWTPLTSLAADIDDSSVTLQVAGPVGTGAIVLAGSERMIVSDRAMTSTGDTISSDLAAESNATLVATATPADFSQGEEIMVDAESMLVTAVTSGLVVKRAWNGTPLAAHTSGAAIYAPRSLTVMRGQLGTAAAAHAEGDPLSAHAAPPLIRELNIALAENTVLQKTSGYARTVGEGDSLRNASGAGLADLIARARARHGRKARTAVV
jgi:hypothetical protein